MLPVRLVTCVLVLAAATLVSCSSTETDAPSGPDVTGPQTPSVVVTGSTDGSAPLTPPGSTLRIGDSAVVSYRALAFPSDATKLEVQVFAVERGDLANLRAENIELGEGVSGHRPWYARARFINRGPGDITDGAVGLATGIMVLDAAGKMQKPATFSVSVASTNASPTGSIRCRGSLAGHPRHVRCSCFRTATNRPG